MRFTNVVLALCVVLLAGLAVAGDAHAASYTLTTTVTTDGVQSLAGGTLAITCRASGSSTWTSCGSSVAAGTSVSIWANANDGYWFMWWQTNPYLAGCTTLYGGWGYGPNPAVNCTFTMPSQNANINAEFQLP